jgi:hypothetical protein
MMRTSNARGEAMRLVCVAIAPLLIAWPAAAATSQIDQRTTLDVVQKWIYNYRAKPDYAHVPAAVRVLFRFQSFREPENSGIYLGFIAGAIGSNPARAAWLVNSLFPVPPEDEWVIVRAIAYSGLPEWQALLKRTAVRVPGRQVMIDDYLSGKLLTLGQTPLAEPKPGFFDKVSGIFSHGPFSREDKSAERKPVTFANSQDLLDVLWGYYFATGSYTPILRIVSMLPWAKSRETVDKLTIGSMAKYTLASYAVRDAALRDLLKSEVKHQPKEVAVVLNEVIEAADTVQIAALRKEALAAVDELKTKGSDSRRNLDFWGQVGVGAVALGCVTAAALGQVELGIPCVIGGSASQGLLSFWEKQQ